MGQDGTTPVAVTHEDNEWEIEVGLYVYMYGRTYVCLSSRLIIGGVCMYARYVGPPRLW